MQSVTLPSSRPALFENLLELFYRLVAAPYTSDATQKLLRKVQLVPSQLETVIGSLLAGKVGPGSCEASPLSLASGVAQA